MSVTISGDIGTIITATALFCGQLGNIWLQWRTAKQTAAKLEENTKLTQETAAKIEEVHAATNGMSKLITEAASREGHAAGVADEKARASGP